MSLITPNSKPPPGTETPIKGTIKMMQVVERLKFFLLQQCMQYSSLLIASSRIFWPSEKGTRLKEIPLAGSRWRTLALESKWQVVADGAKHFQQTELTALALQTIYKLSPRFPSRNTSLFDSVQVSVIWYHLSPYFCLAALERGFLTKNDDFASCLEKTLIVRDQMTRRQMDLSENDSWLCFIRSTSRVWQ